MALHTLSQGFFRYFRIDLSNQMCHVELKLLTAHWQLKGISPLLDDCKENSSERESWNICKTLYENSVFLLFNQPLSDDLISHIRQQHRISALSVDICRNSSKAVHFYFLCCDQKKTFTYWISQSNHSGITWCFRVYWLFSVTSKPPSESMSDLFSLSGLDTVLWLHSEPHCNIQSIFI